MLKFDMAISLRIISSKSGLPQCILIIFVTFSFRSGSPNGCFVGGGFTTVLSSSIPFFNSVFSSISETILVAPDVSGVFDICVLSDCSSSTICWIDRASSNGYAIDLLDTCKSIKISNPSIGSDSASFNNGEIQDKSRGFRIFHMRCKCLVAAVPLRWEAMMERKTELTWVTPVPATYINTNPP